MFLAFVEATLEFSIYKNYMYWTEIYISEFDLSEKYSNKLISYTALAI